jgi:mRNA-degrading endonuclease toxin of MazEF toxin-antitoxin module
LLDKRRPVVILSPDKRNEAASDMIVVPCFSSGREMRWHVYLRKGEGGLSGASVAKCEQITTVPKEFVEREIGMLPEARMRDIERALLSALGIMP